MPAYYARGDTIRLRITATDINGTLGDPTDVQLHVRPPAGAAATYLYSGAQVVRDSTGLYRYDLAIADAAASEGEWRYRWVSTGTIAAGTDDLSFFVHETAVP